MPTPAPEMETLVPPAMKLVPVSVTPTVTPMFPLFGEICDSVGGGGGGEVIVNEMVLDVTPPGFVTLTVAVPAEPGRVTAADSVAEPTNAVSSGTPLKII